MATILEHYMATHGEKRTTQLPTVRCSEALEAALHRLAAQHDRKLTEYIRLVLERHVFGMAANLTVDEEQV